MNRESWVLWAIASAVATALACSSSGSGSIDSYSVTYCPGEGISGLSCASCLNSNCSSQVSDANSKCSSALSCLCPANANPANCTVSSDCETAGMALSNCHHQSCASACSGSSSGAGSGSGSGSGSGGGSGSGSGGSTVVCGLPLVSATCASCVMSNCCSLTQACANDSACVAVISCVQGCQNNTTCENTCVSNASPATQTEITNMAQCWSTSCSSAGC